MSGIRRIRVPSHLPEPISHYTDAVVAGGWIYASGLLALDSGGKLVGGDDVTAQTERIFENLAAVLEAAGARAEHVVKVTIYLRRIGDRAAVNTVRRKFFGDYRPASTLVEVSAFVIPDALLEVDVVAYVGAG